MITGSEEESRALMMNAAIRIVAQYGFEGFTTKKWAAEAGVAEGSLYYHFKSKQDLLDETFFMIDREIASFFQDEEEVPETKEEILQFVKKRWVSYYHYLLDNPLKTLYYNRYRNSPRFTDEIQQKEVTYFGAFRQVVANMDAQVHFTKRIPEDILWYYITDTTTSLAFRVVTGGTNHTEKSEQQMIDLLIHGLSGLIRNQDN